jgi:hypothetical protein
VLRAMNEEGGEAIYEAFRDDLKLVAKKLK